jgi:hypothetical protein
MQLESGSVKMMETSSKDCVNGKPEVRYHIKYAGSRDGIHEGRLGAWLRRTRKMTCCAADDGLHHRDTQL